MKQVYAIDVKIYESVPADCVPFPLPEFLNGNHLKKGYETLVRNWSEKQFDEFKEYCSFNGELIKIIGWKIVPTSEQPKTNE